VGERCGASSLFPIRYFTIRPEKPLSARFVQKITYRMPASGKAISHRELDELSAAEQHFSS